jgi:hypothetical protein
MDNLCNRAPGVCFHQTVLVVPELAICSELIDYCKVGGKPQTQNLLLW